jgi:hypothetical protein
MEGYNPHTSLLPTGNGHITAMSGGGEAPNGYNPTQSLLLTSQVPISAHRGGADSIVSRETIIEGHVFTIDDPSINDSISDNNNKVLTYFGLDGLPDEDKKEVLKDLYKTDFDYPFKYGKMEKILGRLIKAYLTKLKNTNEENSSNNISNSTNLLTTNFFKDYLAALKGQFARFTDALQGQRQEQGQEQKQELEQKQEQEQQTAFELSRENEIAVAAVLGSLPAKDLESTQQESVGVAENVVIEEKLSLLERLTKLFSRFKKLVSRDPVDEKELEVKEELKEVKEELKEVKEELKEVEEELDNVPIDPITFTTVDELIKGLYLKTQDGIKTNTEIEQFKKYFIYIAMMARKKQLEIDNKDLQKFSIKYNNIVSDVTLTDSNTGKLKNIITANTQKQEKLISAVKLEINKMIDEIKEDPPQKLDTINNKLLIEFIKTIFIPFIQERLQELYTEIQQKKATSDKKIDGSDIRRLFEIDKASKWLIKWWTQRKLSQAFKNRSDQFEFRKTSYIENIKLAAELSAISTVSEEFYRLIVTLPSIQLQVPIETIIDAYPTLKGGELEKKSKQVLLRLKIAIYEAYSDAYNKLQSIPAKDKKSYNNKYKKLMDDLIEQTKNDGEYIFDDEDTKTKFYTWLNELIQYLELYRIQINEAFINKSPSKLLPIITKTSKEEDQEIKDQKIKDQKNQELPQNPTEYDIFIYKQYFTLYQVFRHLSYLSFVVDKDGINNNAAKFIHKKLTGKMANDLVEAQCEIDESPDYCEFKIDADIDRLSEYTKWNGDQLFNNSENTGDRLKAFKTKLDGVDQSMKSKIYKITRQNAYAYTQFIFNLPKFSNNNNLPNYNRVAFIGLLLEPKIRYDNYRLDNRIIQYTTILVGLLQDAQNPESATYGILLIHFNIDTDNPTNSFISAILYQLLTNNGHGILQKFNENSGEPLPFDVDENFTRDRLQFIKDSSIENGIDPDVIEDFIKYINSLSLKQNIDPRLAAALAVFAVNGVIGPQVEAKKEAEEKVRAEKETDAVKNTFIQARERELSNLEEGLNEINTIINKLKLHQLYDEDTITMLDEKYNGLTKSMNILIDLIQRATINKVELPQEYLTISQHVTNAGIQVKTLKEKLEAIKLISTTAIESGAFGIPEIEGVINILPETLKKEVAKKINSNAQKIIEQQAKKKANKNLLKQQSNRLLQIKEKYTDHNLLDTSTQIEFNKLKEEFNKLKLSLSSDKNTELTTKFGEESIAAIEKHIKKTSKKEQEKTKKLNLT